MSDQDNDKKPSIFRKMLDAGEAILDQQIRKASTDMNQVQSDDFLYSKAITEDPSYAINASGWKEKPHRLMDGHLKQMSLKNTIVAAIIQTRQNQVSNHSKLVRSEKERGFIIKLRDEEALLEEIKEKLREESSLKNKHDIENEVQSENVSNDDEDEEIQSEPGDSQSDDDVEEYNFELERKAKEKLESQFKDAKKRVQDYLLNCGKVDGKPFDKRKWTFDLALRALVRDSLTYDRYAVEVVPNRASKPSYWFPVDGSTIKFASERLKDYKELAENFINLDLLYPEKKTEAIEKQKVLDLDQDLLENNQYRYVQVIRGKIERAYTGDELKLGIRNPTTDIYNNGYGISELELAVSLITGHLNAEFYNQAYFTQGFSAKGILHIKAPLNRRKVETIRQQWQHMLRGARNSFQTPIFAGMDDVEWIPLTQNHQDIGFEGWMRYLTKMICAIYQIDPREIGVGLKDEGSGGSGLSGDDTKEKLEQSKDKGLYPLLRHVENFFNEEIIKPFDDRFVMQFTGATAESQKESLERQDVERKFKKTLNEVRAEDGLPPLPGGDEIILGSEYMQWYLQMSPKAIEQKGQMQQNGTDGDLNSDEGSQFDLPEDSLYNGDNFEDALLSPEDEVEKSLKKSRRLKVEYYKIGE